MSNHKMFSFSIFILFLVVSNFTIAQRIIPTGRNVKIEPKHLIKNKTIKTKTERNKKSTLPDRNRSKRIVKNKKRERFPHPKINHKRNRVKNIIRSESYDDNYYVDPNYTEENIINTDNNTFVPAIENNNRFNPFPNFPLRFIKGEITYLDSYIDNNNDNQMRDIYDLNIQLKVINDDYFYPFGILLEYADGEKQLEVFNKEENFLYWNNTYTFTRNIEILEPGYINLRIGYFDTDKELFYPEKNIQNKTNLLLYILQNEKDLSIQE